MNEPRVATSNSAPVQLKRALKLWDLIIIGIVIIQPIAPMGIYGVINNNAGGHVVTTILIAMVAMLFTAISYGKMARAYPSAGSAYTYVGEEIHPALGYITGWAMVMDYILNPLICTVLCSKLTQNILPGMPYWVLAIAYATLFTLLNLRGIKTSARINDVLAAGMSIVVVVFFAFVIRFIWGLHEYGAGFFTQPLLQSRDIQFPRSVPRYVDRSAYLHRIRCDFHFVGGGRKSAAQRDACDLAGLRDHGCLVVARSVCRTTRLGIEAFSARHG